MTPDNLRERLTRLAALDRQRRLYAIGRELRSLIRPGTLQPLLHAFVDSLHQRQTQEHLSYRHDNGFDKIVLFHYQEQKIKVRLHIWSPMPPPGRRPRQ